jgi:predicted transcriptional regulator
MQNRSRFEIIAEILRSATADGGVSRTKIMYYALTSNHQSKEYIAFLIKKGLLESFGSKCYKTTKRGLELLTMYDKLGEYLHYETSIGSALTLPPNEL